MDYRFVTQAGLQEQNWKTGCIRRIESNEMKQSGIELDERLALTEYNLIPLVAMRSGDTPVPIPNTMVKT